MNAAPANHAAAPRRRSGESGYAFVMAMALILAVIIGSQVVLQNLATEGRREREQETVWRGKQWARAIRLYYHKTGHYPQSIDDLQDGVPDMHFLRASAVKDPMDSDGSWRLIYVNATGQIIGSVRYATLQQMALLDLNNGQLPAALPGAVSAASLSSTFENSDNSNNGPNAAASSPPPANSSDTNSGSSSVGGTSGQSPAGNAPPSDSSQNSSSSEGNSASTAQSASSTDTQPFGQGQSASTFGSSTSTALGPDPNPFAQIAQLQPTGPVDGPVPGAFLTGVGIPVSVGAPSIKFYHGAKKYKDWEFIWNPLEDQAQAIQQGLSIPAQGGQPGQGQAPGSSSFGPGSTSTFGNSGAPPAGGTNPQSSPPNQQ
ncbi:MAG TPA: hypothetical protein VMB02_11085 [Candidatus Aquilonibacter sp.]|nr:hypothetical protein [Candidatus Aquilonibacter sp.]